MLALLAMILNLVTTRAYAQDIIVKKDGTILNVYNLEESSNSYFYTLEATSGANVLKINKDDVFSIKKKDGTTVTAEPAASQPAATAHREPVTAQLSSEITTKKGKKSFSARTPDGHELNYTVLSPANRTLAVVKGEYHESEYVIPEKVQVNDEVYVVTEIGDEAFVQEYTVRDVQFPTTLKRIGENAFTYSALERIILPEGIEELAANAFLWTGWKGNFLVTTNNNRVSEIYIPSTIKKIGSNCFLRCGNELSFRGYCKAYFSSLPDFVTESNCLSFGIDEEAVRACRSKTK